MLEWAIPVAALIVSATALLITGVGVRTATNANREAIDTRRQAASQEYVTQLEHRINECEQGRKELREDNRRLQSNLDTANERELDLLRQVLDLRNKVERMEVQSAVQS